MPWANVLFSSGYVQKLKLVRRLHILVPRPSDVFPSLANLDWFPWFANYYTHYYYYYRALKSELTVNYPVVTHTFSSWKWLGEFALIHPLMNEEWFWNWKENFLLIFWLFIILHLTCPVNFLKQCSNGQSSPAPFPQYAMKTMPIAKTTAFYFLHTLLQIVSLYKNIKFQKVCKARFRCSSSHMPKQNVNLLKQ